ncbi:MAG: hypothetical protein ACD_62C00465G0001 [uncultured bacterium]|nr:MAG: hypothetical protein ACD_62C00465G0001 [uncultured bacterium]
MTHALDKRGKFTILNLDALVHGVQPPFPERGVEHLRGFGLGNGGADDSKTHHKISLALRRSFSICFKRAAGVAKRISSRRRSTKKTRTDLS